MYHEHYKALIYQTQKTLGNVIAVQLHWKKWRNEISKITKSLLKTVYLTKVVS